MRAWKTPEDVLNAANELAKRANEVLSIEHFWQAADKAMPGHAPKDVPGLAARAMDYLCFDQAVAQYGYAGDPDVDASIKRIKILESLPGIPKEITGIERELETVKVFCKTSLLFLSREIFDKWFTFRTHARIANFFIQKNPTLKIYEQDETKQRVLLYPRGSFKSTLNIVDAVQFCINWPDVRVIVLTAEVKLAESFVAELKQYFKILKNGKPTIFQRLFPEFCITNYGSEDEFICPCRTPGDDSSREPTVWASSILSNLPGYHCDLMVLDDSVNDRNSATAILIDRVNTKVDYAESLIDPGGYVNYVGTIYSSKDLYTHVQEHTLNPDDLKVMLKPAMWPKKAAEGKPEKDMQPADWELLFEFDKLGKPQLDFAFLARKKFRNFSAFQSQYMLSASGVNQVKFSKELLIDRTLNPDQLPVNMVFYTFWDFAYGLEKKNDYSTGAAIGLDEEGRAFVVEMVRARMKDSELAQAIVDLHKKYQSRLVHIENSNGAQLLETTIKNTAEKAGLSHIPLDFFKVDRTLNAKARRIWALEPLLAGARLFFNRAIPFIEDLYREFKDFGESSHDDIPDVISQVHRVIPSQSMTLVSRREEISKRNQELAMRQFDNLIYGVVETPIIETPIEAVLISDDDIVDPYAVPGFR
jgi:predicted phage terminase large subunit-like protein